MKKKILVVSAAALFAAGCAGTCLAAEATQQDKHQVVLQEKPGGTLKTAIFQGAVNAVNLDSKTIEVIKKSMDIGLVFDASKAVFKGCKDLKDIKGGDTVTVEYDVKLGRSIALVITKGK
jgi:hypothetical protein